jgi:tetratricopeptide (TPR) repeat protein
VSATPPNHPSRPEYLSNLGIALQVRFEGTGQQTDLDRAIALGRDAMSATPNHPKYLSNLGAALQTRFRYTGRSSDLDEAIAVGRKAVSATPPGRPSRSKRLSNLGTALQSLFGRTGQSSDLDEAIAIGRKAVAATPPDHPDRSSYLSNLGAALQTRFRYTGQQADLDEAIAVGREALSATPPDHPGRPKRLSNLGAALHGRFELAGQQADLDEAIAAARDAVAAIPPEHPDRPMYQSNLGTALQALFRRTGELADLDEAIAAGGHAVVDTSPEHPNRPMYLSNLGAALQTRFESIGKLPMLTEKVVELAGLYTRIRPEISTGYTEIPEEVYRDRIKELIRHISVQEETIQHLAEWRLEKLAAATLELPSNTSGSQVLPVRYYLDTDNRAVAEKVESALESLLDEHGFRVAMLYPVETGSFFRKLFYASRERLTPDEVAASLAKIERAAGVRALDLPQSQIDANRADGVAKLLAALEGSPSAVIQIGSILLVKIDGIPVVTNLTPQELAQLEREPDLFRSPNEVLDVLHKLRQSSWRRDELPVVGLLDSGKPYPGDVA